MHICPCTWELDIALPPLPPPQKMLQIRSSKITSEAIFGPHMTPVLQERTEMSCAALR